MSNTLSFTQALHATGLASGLRAQLVDGACANVGSEIVGGWTEGGNGFGKYFYMWTYTNTDNHAGGVKFYQASAPTVILDMPAINPQELENADTKTSTRATPAQVATELGTYDAPTKAELDAAIAPLALEATLATVDNLIDTEIGSIQSAIALLSTAAALATVQADTDAIQLAITALNNLSAAQVNAEVDTALLDVGLTSVVTGRIDAAISTRSTPTNITAGVITTVTNLTNAPTSGDLTATMKSSVTTAATAATPIAASITGNVGGNVVGSVASVVAGVTLADGAITAAKIATDAITDAKVSADVTIASVTGSVGSVTSGVTVTTNNDKTGYGLSAAAVQAIWDALTSALTAIGSIGKRIVDNLDATISSRMATFTYTVPPTVAAIRSEIDTNSTKLDAAVSSRATPAQLATELTTYDVPTFSELDARTDAIDAAIAALNDLSSAQAQTATTAALNAYDPPTKAELDTAVAPLATTAALTIIDDFLDTEILAIKAKTDLMPASPAATGDIPSAAAISDAVWDELQTGHVTAGTFGKYLDDEITDITASVDAADFAEAMELYNVATSMDIAALGAVHSITILSAINGDDITVYRNDTWSFSGTVTFVLTDYEAVAFVVKPGFNTADNDSLLYVRSAIGLVRMNGLAATSGKGSLTVTSATTFDVLIDIDQTDVAPGTYQWWLKGFDATPTPDQGRTIATGKFVVKPYGLRAIA